MTTTNTAAAGTPALGASLRSMPSDPPERILIVEDDEQTRRMLARSLADDGFVLELVNSPVLAVEKARSARFALVICDVHMPGRSGIDLVRELASTQPQLGILMISGDDNPRVAAFAAERGGALSYLVKPFSPNQLRINVANALLRRRLAVQASDYQESLRLGIEQRTRELHAAIEELRVSQEETIRHLSKAVEMRDARTHAHIDRIGSISALLARGLGRSAGEVELLRLAAPMHDVGKIGIADRILLKPGPLTDDERREIERHTTIGYAILSGSNSELLDLAATIALDHHERVDGEGYPRRLRGEEIRQPGRIVAVADVFDSLISERVYSKAMPVGEAVQVMEAGRGTQFDPPVLDALFRLIDDIVAL